MTDKVDRLAEQEAVLAAKLKSTREERLREEARLASRRAELVGKVVLKQVKEGKLEDAWLHSLLDENLTRKADRALFDLKRVSGNERLLESESERVEVAEVEHETVESDSPGDLTDDVELASPTTLLGR